MRQCLKQIESVTGKSLKRIYIVGGGSKNQYLNGLIAARTKFEVHRGAVESSTIGNVAVQFAVLDGDRIERSWCGAASRGTMESKTLCVGCVSKIAT